ncbi:MAG: Protease HtpX [candidate division WS2 bacterium]|uniref:Protease HtpX homolog n=1 Tax=Psychracetigena formicireducens TaxID=2986056 RepID=A0A9E2BHE2_PSYF1|nr:Protease HtpX [Candidatus Psychracetigena formicireducens]MBT9145099.1 Protease HtpX [Candidatus Psychracetigena formicireducens]MBT9150793.1 Protease HtpX [Candidatus Psychracetigena formicireducens]
MSLTGQIRQNISISLILVMLMSGIIVGIGYIFDFYYGYHGFLTGMAVVFASITSVGSYWYSDKLVLSLSAAREAPYSEYRYLHNITEGLAIAAGIPKPKLFIIDDPAANAFATGRNPANGVIVVSTGLLNLLNRQEIEGVIAHEIGHLKNYDVLLGTIAAVLVGSVVILRDVILRFGFRKGVKRGRGGNPLLLIIGVLLLILAPFFMTLIKFAVSRQREFLADATSAYLTRFPDGLIKALEKLEANKKIPLFTSEAMAHLYIVNPFSQSFDQIYLLSTHPPIEARVLRLKSIRGL